MRDLYQYVLHHMVLADLMLIPVALLLAALSWVAFYAWRQDQ